MCLSCATTGRGFKSLRFIVVKCQPQGSSAQFNGKVHSLLHLMRPHVIRDSSGIWHHNSNEIQGLDSWFIRHQRWLFNILISKEKEKGQLVDFFHLFFNMLENKWAFIFQLFNKRVSQLWLQNNFSQVWYVRILTIMSLLSVTDKTRLPMPRGS